MQQNIQKIGINKLRLWTENPRDPIDASCSDADIIVRALEHNRDKWNLDKLLNEFGDYYDFSELPTVVLKDSEYIVYDGNRRIALIKCLQNKTLYQASFGQFMLTPAPQQLIDLREIPCNVCDEETALNNIERKHTNNGSWGQLERDYFAFNFRNAKKSDFQIIEESTHIISTHNAVNQRFVKEEVLTRSNLEKIGFSIINEKLLTIYPEETTRTIFDNIVNLLENKKISTRNNRQKLKEPLLENNPKLKEILTPYKTDKGIIPVNLNYTSNKQVPIKNIRKTPTSKQEDILFGEPLSLRQSKTNDLYRAIDRIYQSSPNDATILPVIGMSLRLLLETAAREEFELQKNRPIQRKDGDIYRQFMQRAKEEMPQTSLNFKNVTLNWLDDEENIEAILSKYAHGEIPYEKGNIIKTSIVVADILKLYYKKT